MRLSQLHSVVLVSGLLVTSCTLDFDECLIEGRCPPTDGPRSCVSEPGTPWLVSFGGAETQRVLGTSVDPCDGEVVVVGEMNRAMVLHPEQHEVVASGGAWDLFVARLTQSGSVRFAASFGGTASTDWVRPSDVVIDELGNAVVAGAFSGTVDFGGEVRSSQMTDAFLATYSPDGALRWLRTFGGEQQDEVVAITIDATDGHIFATGTHGAGASFFGETPGTSTQDVFVLRLTPDGDQPTDGEFLFRLGGAGAQSGHAVQVDANRVYVAGTFREEIDPFTEPPTPGDPGSNVFVAAFAKGGGVAWLTTVMGDGEEVAPQIALAAGLVTVTVNTNGPVSNACGDHMPSTGAIIVTSVQPDTGTCTGWLAIGGNGDDAVRSMAIARNGNPVLAGSYTADLVTPSLMARDIADVFVIELAAGTPVRSERIEASGTGDDVASIRFGNHGERVLGGHFNDEVMQGSDMATTDGGVDGFLMYALP